MLTSVMRINRIVTRVNLVSFIGKCPLLHEFLHRFSSSSSSVAAVQSKGSLRYERHLARYDAIIRAIDCRLPRSFTVAFQAPSLRDVFLRIVPPRLAPSRTERTSRRCIVCSQYEDRIYRAGTRRWR